MKTYFPEEYYREKYDYFMSVPLSIKRTLIEKDYIERLSAYNALGLSDEAVKVLSYKVACEVASYYESELKNRMPLYSKMLIGKENSGYTNVGQALEYRRDTLIDFEFACIQLADFKKKYNVEKKNKKVLTYSQCYGNIYL